MKTISDLLIELETARQVYDRCANDAGEARRNETAALNTLNDAQKAVDAAVAKLKGEAPRGSNWKQERGV